MLPPGLIVLDRIEEAAAVVGRQSAIERASLDPPNREVCLVRERLRRGLASWHQQLLFPWRVTGTTAQDGE